MIQPAKATFLFAQGKEKCRILVQALEQPDDIVSLPVRLVIDSKWILDTNATEQLNKKTLS